MKRKKNGHFYCSKYLLQKSSKAPLNNQNTPRLPALPPTIRVQRTSRNRRQVFSDQYLLRSLPVKSILSEITEKEEKKDHCFGRIRMHLIMLAAVFTISKGILAQSKSPPLPRSQFIKTTTGYRALSWLRQLSSSLSSSIHCPDIKPHPSPSTHLPPSLNISLSSCLGELISRYTSTSVLFGLAQGFLQLRLAEDSLAVAKVHLGQLVSPVVVLGDQGVTKVFNCLGEKNNEVWTWDRRALETLRYSDSRRRLNLVNFEGNWHAWGERTDDSSQVKKESLPILNMLSGASCPWGSHPGEVLLQTGLQDAARCHWKGGEAGGRSQWIRCQLLAQWRTGNVGDLERWTSEKGLSLFFRDSWSWWYSIFIKTKKTFSLQGKWWGLDEATFLREKVTPNIPQGSQVDNILRSHSSFEITDGKNRIIIMEGRKCDIKTAAELQRPVVNAAGSFFTKNRLCCLPRVWLHLYQVDLRFSAFW